ncbi:hypothetical protein JST97_18980 [bacterium]|nr:hypothetical protein [bacterium]
MNCNQIALKPFVGRLAQREGMSYDQLIKGTASELAQVPAEAFTQSPEVKGSTDMAALLRVKSTDMNELKGDLTTAGVSPEVAQGYANMMVVTALAMDPCAAVGLDGVMRILMSNEKPLGQSAVENGQLNLAPSLNHLAEQMGQDLTSLLKEAAKDCKEAKPSESDLARVANTTKIASAFRVNSSEIEKLQGTLSEEGLNAQQSEALISGLVLNAVAFEPTLRKGLDQMTGLAMQEAYQGRKPMTESSIVAG